MQFFTLTPCLVMERIAIGGTKSPLPSSCCPWIRPLPATCRQRGTSSFQRLFRVYFPDVYDKLAMG
jgi:hypothetical protein